MKTHFASLPDEYFVHPSSLKAQSLINETTGQDYKKHRENIQRILAYVSKLHDIVANRISKLKVDSAELNEMSEALIELTGEPNSPHQPQSIEFQKLKNLAFIPNWLAADEVVQLESTRTELKKSASELSILNGLVANQWKEEEDDALDKLSFIIDVIIGYQELCQRHEKGTTAEHHRAIRQLNQLKKLTSGSGVGLVDTQQNIEAIERSVHQVCYPSNIIVV